MLGPERILFANSVATLFTFRGASTGLPLDSLRSSGSEKDVLEGANMRFGSSAPSDALVCVVRQEDTTKPRVCGGAAYGLRERTIRPGDSR